MHPDEVGVDRRLVRRLLEAQFPDLADLPVRRVDPAGTDNALYRLGEELVVRLPRTERASGTLVRERRWLPRLATGLPLAVPRPVADGAPGEGYPFEWSVYGWLEGESANPDRVGDPTQLALDLAGLVGALQRIDSTGGPAPSELNAFRGVPLATRDARTRAAIDSLHDAIDAGVVTAVWDSALDAAAWARPPVWIHGDLDSRNLLASGGRLTAAIDWGCLGVGDPACDVMVAWKMLPSHARHTFRETLAVDDPTWARARGWALSQALVALSYYTPETNPTLVREARRWVAEVSADRASSPS